MRVRDRLLLAVVAAVVVVAATWILLVSPERSQVGSISTQIGTARSALVTAQGQLASARSAASGYIDEVHQVDNVMRAVPPSPDEPALIRTITRLAGTKVDFHELDVGGGSATAAGPVSLGLAFTFYTSYKNLQSFLAALDALTSTNGSRVSSNDRLFTINSVSLSPQTATTTKATVDAQVYLQGATAAPTGATGATGAPASPAVTG